VFLVANQRTVLLVANQGTAIELGHHLAPGLLGIRISHFVPGAAPAFCLLLHKPNKN
jgi:hypothetical protein